MSSVSNLNPVQFNSNELMQKVVGKVHRRDQTLDIISKQPPIPVGLLERIKDAVIDFFVGFTKEGKAQKEMRNGLQGLAIQINTGAMDGVEATVKAFSARVKALEPSLEEPQVASLFKETMVALSTARRNPIEALAADKVEQVTKEINSALGIKEATVTSLTSSFPYRKAAVAVAGLAVLGIAAYFGISALLASDVKLTVTNLGKFKGLQRGSATIDFSGLTNDEQIKLHTDALKEYILANKMRPVSEPIFSSFDSSWTRALPFLRSTSWIRTLPFLRSNVVMIRIAW